MLRVVTLGAATALLASLKRFTSSLRAQGRLLNGMLWLGPVASLLYPANCACTYLRSDTPDSHLFA